MPPVVPLEAFNWGAFGLTWICLSGMNANGTAVGTFCLSLVPFGGCLAAFYLSFNENPIARRYRQFEDEGQFRAVQKAWSQFGIACVGIEILFTMVVGIVAFHVAKPRTASYVAAPAPGTSTETSPAPNQTQAQADNPPRETLLDETWILPAKGDMSGYSDGNLWYKEQSFTVTTSAVITFTFDPNEECYAGIINPNDVDSFEGGDDVSGFLAFDDVGGTKTVTLGPGDDVIAVRNDAIMANTVSAQAWKTGD